MKNTRMIGNWITDNSNLLIAGAVLAVGSAAIGTAIWRRMRPSASTFIMEAYSCGLAEVEAAELALQKSSSSNVKAFAQHMIEDHSEINKELQALAERKNLHLTDSTRLSDKTKAYLLKHKEGQSFDEAYLEQMVHSHRNALRLYRRAANSGETDVRYFAAITITKLNSHFKMAQKLLKAVTEYRAIRTIQQETHADAGNGSRVPLTASQASLGKQPN